jgi:hypothetical protein
MAERWDNVEAFVAAVGGRRVIRKVLIANNGIAAVKAIRSIRRWAYETFGNEREVRGREGGGEGERGRRGSEKVGRRNRGGAEAVRASGQPRARGRPRGRSAAARPG